MNKRFIFAIVILVYFSSFNSFPAAGQEKLKGRISISGAFALYGMAVKWAEEFQKINPAVKIDISAGGAGKGITDVLNNMVDIGMVSRDIYSEEIKNGAIPITVAKDAVVAVVNSANPLLNDIMSVGMTAECASNIWLSGKYKKWGQPFKSQKQAPIHVYTRSDACGAAEVWGRYFDAKQEDLLGSAVFGDPGLALAIRKDILGIGYNNICYAYDFVTKKQFKGISVVPIDLNGSGKIEEDERFYDSLDRLIDAVEKGKYPSPPARDLYFVITNQKKNKLKAEFLKWVLTEGQKYVRESGYVSISRDKASEEFKKIR